MALAPPWSHGSAPHTFVHATTVLETASRVSEQEELREANGKKAFGTIRLILILFFIKVIHASGNIICFK
jgi:hypothetical protein